MTSIRNSIARGRFRGWRRGGEQGKSDGRTDDRADRPTFSSAPLSSSRGDGRGCRARSSGEHTSELQSLMRISYAVFCVNKKPRSHTSPTQQSTHSQVTRTHKTSTTSYPTL